MHDTGLSVYENDVPIKLQFIVTGRIYSIKHQKGVCIKCCCVAEGTDNLNNAFDGSTTDIGDCILALYAAIHAFSGW